MHGQTHIKRNLNYLDGFWEITQISKFMKIRPVGAELRPFAFLRTRLKISHLKLHTEKIAVCSLIHTEHRNTQCGQNLELWNVELVVSIVTMVL